MGFLKPPKIPAPPPLEMPDPEDVPSLEDEAREREEAEKMRRRQLNRKGRRSTILTGTGLAEIEDENIDQKTLLGG
ncbi:hypothetical protein [uncultured Mediterranean phage uvMED]|nr:hypothetical protein [uncultured Mediterranean phage uvMED]